jgi:ATP/maltotriose-dependent transcriptional regulator MalT
MMMSYFLHDSLDEVGLEQIPTTSRSKRPAAQRDDLRILKEKLKIPQPGRLVSRPRLDEMLGKSLSQYCATLISGRAGTGKTALAADFARQHGRAGWYAVESSDSDWDTFSAYFAACVDAAAGGRGKSKPATACDPASEPQIAQFLVNTFAPVAAKSSKEFLIVLDDLHRIFDAEWFGPFFHLLLYSLPENCRLLLLCRSKPPNPLWRLRSKQMLNVIDEKLLAFDPGETAQLFKGKGLSPEEISKAHADSFGRLSRLIVHLSK